MARLYCFRCKTLTKSKVIDTAEAEDDTTAEGSNVKIHTIYRRRKCEICDFRYGTRESVIGVG